MNTWWYIHTATLYQLCSKWTLMRYTYRNFISIFLQVNTWWYIHTATLRQLSCRCTPDDIYIPQLYINVPADEHLMICTYRNFISSFQQMNTWWYIHTALYFSFPADGHVVIYTYCNFISTFLLWTPDDIYTLQLYINFPADEHGMIYRYRNFISTFLQMNTFWYIHTTTVYQFWSRWTRDDK